ncbi:hypothetical protein QYF36_025153 [Acer negundo]|nr:hypothetical protein QYF36_025153 [Acer negundo]
MEQTVMVQNLLVKESSMRAPMRGVKPARFDEEAEIAVDQGNLWSRLVVDDGDDFVEIDDCDEDFVKKMILGD